MFGKCPQKKHDKDLKILILKKISEKFLARCFFKVLVFQSPSSIK